MVHSLKRFWLVVVLFLAGATTVFGFSLLGPVNEAFQDPTIGYNEVNPAIAFPNLGGFVDRGAPKNLAEGYRYNTKFIYYAFDTSFLDYFGSIGVVEVDKAFAIYNALANLSSYSSDLSEFPMNSSRINPQGSALLLFDLKSAVMSLIAEQLGLAQPDRWTYCLHDRFTPAGAVCPNFTYLVIERNYDPASQNYSRYVNGVLYDYIVQELCTLNPNTFAPLLADAIEVLPDANSAAAGSSAIAARNSVIQNGLYYSGLTRDDVGGFRYLMATNRMNVEAVDPNSVQVFTNTSQVQLLVTSNLSVFIQQALTNDPVTLAGLYPGLLIIQSSNFFSNVITTNITAYFTNFNNTPPGSAPQPVLVTNLTTNVGTFFVHTFGNLVTNHFYTNGFITTTTTNIGPPVGAYPGAPLQTNVTSKTIFTNFINGDFYLIPANALCGGGFQILSTQLVSVITVTNTFVTATNAPGVTNANGQSFSFDIVTYFTNYSLQVFPIQCLGSAATVALREGVDKIVFVRQDFDSLLGGLWTPATNYYNLTAVTNGAAVVQRFQRIITQPDFLFDAADLTSGPGGVPFVPPYTRTAPNFNTAQALNGLAGPGTITPGATFTFNKVGPIFINANSFFINGGIGNIPDANFSGIFQWGSFDGTTNSPVIYPTNSSLTALQSQVFFQITNSAPFHASISTNTAGNPFSAQLGAAGGSPPYSWSLAPNSPALPNNINLSAGGLLSGVPHTLGTFDFIVKVTDAGLRSTEAALTIQIGP